MKMSLVPGIALAAFAVGCSGAGAPPPPATTMAGQAAPARAGATTAAASEFGVAECDSYIRKYLACIDSKVPADQRAMVRQSLDMTKAQWKQAATTPEQRQALAASCVQAEAGAKQAMASYGCTW